MSGIGSASGHARDIFSLFSADSRDPSRVSGGIAAPGRSAARHRGDRHPATRIDLSDKVKDILARAGSDQDIADRLKAFVESRRSGGPDGFAHDKASRFGGRFDVTKGFEQLSGSPQAGDDFGDYQPVEVGKTFATGLKADGYTISAVARASDGSFQVQIVGPDGTSFLDRRFGTTGEFSAFGGIEPGVAAQAYQRGNKEYISFTESEAAATSVAVSSDAGSLSATSAATHNSSVTFVVDFSTGAISMAKLESIEVSTTVQIDARTPFSTLA